MSLLSKQNKGHHAEELAYQFLLTKGLRLLAKNYRCSHGEIDIIMQDQDDIVFIEVRSRYCHGYLDPAETVNRKKQQKLIKTGIHFLQKRQWLYKVCSRFDVIAIQFDQNNRWQLEWLKHAFWLEQPLNKISKLEIVT
jgi:putative endonuclease